jgi:hypothetical protein
MMADDGSDLGEQRMECTLNFEDKVRIVPTSNPRLGTTGRELVFDRAHFPPVVQKAAPATRQGVPGPTSGANTRADRSEYSTSA